MAAVGRAMALGIRHSGQVLAAATLAAGGLMVGVAITALGVKTSPGFVLMALAGLAFMTISLRHPTALLLGLVLVIPFGQRPVPFGMDAIQAVAMVVVGLLVVRQVWLGRAPLLWAAPMSWALWLVLLALLSLPEAPDHLRAVRQIVSVLLACAVPLAVVTICRSLRQLRLLVMAMVVVGGAVCAMSLAGASSLRAEAGARRVDNRLHGIFTEPNQFGIFSAFILLLSVGMLLGARDLRERVVSGLSAAASGLGLLLALSRGAWIGTALAMLLLVALLPQARRWLVIGIGGALILTGIAGTVGMNEAELSVVTQRIGTVTSPLDNPYDNRPAIWREARREIRESPWLGQGAGQFPVTSRRVTSNSTSVSAEHAHNTLLTAAVELGIPSVFFVIALTLSLLQRLRRTVALLRAEGNADASLVAGVGAAASAVVGQGLVDFTLRNAVLLLVLSFLVGLMLAADRTVWSSRSLGAL